MNEKRLIVVESCGGCFYMNTEHGNNCVNGTPREIKDPKQIHPDCPLTTEKSYQASLLSEIEKKVDATNVDYMRKKDIYAIIKEAQRGGE